jgi:hypothetical protein
VRRFVDCVSRDTNSVRNFRHRRWLVANTRIADQWTAMLEVLATLAAVRPGGFDVVLAGAQSWPRPTAAGCIHRELG